VKIKRTRRIALADSGLTEGEFVNVQKHRFPRKLQRNSIICPAGAMSRKPPVEDSMHDA
jgi:hypothetical protein